MWPIKADRLQAADGNIVVGAMVCADIQACHRIFLLYFIYLMDHSYERGGLTTLVPSVIGTARPYPVSWPLFAASVQGGHNYPSLVYAGCKGSRNVLERRPQRTGFDTKEREDSNSM